jgi:hypothetical protein
VCISQGFPALPFVVDEDLTREDGVIVCRHLGAEEVIQLGWRVARAIRIITTFGGFL